MCVCVCVCACACLSVCVYVVYVGVSVCLCVCVCVYFFYYYYYKPNVYNKPLNCDIIAVSNGAYATWPEKCSYINVTCATLTLQFKFETARLSFGAFNLKGTCKSAPFCFALM